MTLPPALGILGGTFDPIHCGHLALAREILEGARLGEVRLVPAGDPPHRAIPAASAGQRLTMARLAVEGCTGLHVDPREVERRGRSYTFLTLSELRAEHPGTPLALLVGADAFLELPTWHRWRELFDLAHIVVVARPGTPFERPTAPELAAEWTRRVAAGPDALQAASAGAIVRIPVTPHPISASAIRAALGRGDVAAVRGLLPPAVLAYIERNRLYQPGQDAT